MSSGAGERSGRGPAREWVRKLRGVQDAETPPPATSGNPNSGDSCLWWIVLIIFSAFLWEFFRGCTADESKPKPIKRSESWRGHPQGGAAPMGTLTPGWR